MPIPLELPPELEAAARREAARRGVPLARFLTQAVIAQLPADACPDAIRALFRGWVEEEHGQDADRDDEFDFDELVRNMNASRAGERPPFLPGTKGVTW